ncbi:hypothetical protein [Litchfieldella anticariensis]|nr:hypothetical protein [Halomonas anticariensis]
MSQANSAIIRQARQPHRLGLQFIAEVVQERSRKVDPVTDKAAVSQAS